MSVASANCPTAISRPRSPSNPSAGSMAATTASELSSVSTDVKQRLFVLLQVAVVGERQPFKERQRLHEVADDARALASGELRDVGVLLLRHDARAGREGVGQPHEAELGRRPEDHLLGTAARGAPSPAPPSSGTRSRSHGQRPRRGSSRRPQSNPSSRATDSRSMGYVTPASAPEPSGSTFTRARVPARSARCRARTSLRRPAGGARAAPAARAAGACSRR